MPEAEAATSIGNGKRLKGTWNLSVNKVTKWMSGIKRARILWK